MTRAPVAIVGAGPVGLCLALRIAQCGAPVVVLEKREALSKASKASTFHPPSLEVLHALGVWTPGQGGEIVDRVQFRERDAGVVAELNLSLLAGETPFPHRLHLEQAELTPLLLVALRRRGVEVLFGAEFEALTQTTAGVSLAYLVGGAVKTLMASAVVGADGARSRMREAIGATFEGADYASRVLRLMTKAALEEDIPGLAPLTYLFARDGSISLLKMPDCWRIILRVPAELSDDAVLDPAWFEAELAKFLPVSRARLGEIGADVFAVGKRVASRYADGRAFIIGDAAHITNTRGGMNMNCGIHDAWALGARLAEVWNSGDLEPALACAAARRKVALEQLIPRTDRAVVKAGAWMEQVRALASDADAARLYLRETSMLDMAERP
ncbi:MAG: NAD(P)/FAD-dependent oxidoreductase [Hyphomonadaceae bacterium]